MITDFLSTSRTKDELSTTLTVVREFKACESENEYIGISLGAWAKLEQLEEFLSYLVENEPLQADTIEYMARMNQR